MKIFNQFLLIALIIAIGVTVLYFGITWYQADYDWDCLDDFARSYCDELNINFKEESVGGYFGGHFVCMGERDARTNTVNWTHPYFLDEEKDECRIKEKMSWREK